MSITFKMCTLLQDRTVLRKGLKVCRTQTAREPGAALNEWNRKKRQLLLTTNEDYEIR